MAFCKDPSITFLNDFGYNVIKLPRKGIEPLDVIGKDKSIEWLGKLSAVWKTQEAEPVPGDPQPVAQIEGQKSRSVRLSVGLTILENALSAFGAKTPSVAAAYHSAQSVTFTYTNVFSIAVPPLDAGNYLTSGSIATANPVVSRYFVEGDARAFLIFDVLKSDSITVTASDAKGSEVSVDVPALESLLSGSVSVAPDTARNSTVTFQGKEAVTFGFRAFEMKLMNGRWQLAGAKASAGLAFAAVAAGGTPVAVNVMRPVVFQSGGLLRL